MTIVNDGTVDCIRWIINRCICGGGYMGAGFSKIRWKNLVPLSVLFGGIQLGVLVLGNLITLLPLLSITRTKTAADRWEGLTVLIFAALGIYMILKGIRKKKVLERRKDEIEWKKTTLLALVTSVDAFFVGMGLGFLDTAMIEESLVLFPVTVLEAVIGIFAGYRLGLKENRRAYWSGEHSFYLSSFDVILHYYT